MKTYFNLGNRKASSTIFQKMKKSSTLGLNYYESTILDSQKKKNLIPITSMILLYLEQEIPT